MVIGSITMYLINKWRHDSDCRSTLLHIFMGSAMYVSYFVLFLDFFYKAYMKKRAAKPAAGDASNAAATACKIKESVSVWKLFLHKKVKV